MSSMYFLAFAFLASTSILFLLWHCRVSRARAQERRRLETQDSLDDATLAAVASAAAAAAAVAASEPPAPRGAPLLLVRSLPTFVWGSKQNAKGDNGSEADTLAAGGSVDLGYCDVELGLCAADQRCGADVRAPSCEGDGESAEQNRRQQEWRDGRCVDAEQPGASRAAGAAHPHQGWDQQHQHTQQVQQDGQQRRGGDRMPHSSWEAADAGSDSGDDDGAGSSVAEAADAEECSICLCGYADGDVLKQLPCRHSFHSSCIDTWLRNHSPTCPLCKHQLWEPNPLSVQHALAGYLELLSLRRQQDEARARRAAERQAREQAASAPDAPAPLMPCSPPAPAAVFGGVLSGARAAAAAVAAAVAAARAEVQAGASDGGSR